MVDPVEERLQIEIDHDPITLGPITLGPITLGNLLPCLGEGRLRPAPRAKAETRSRERRIEDRLQDLHDGLLDPALDHRRDAPLPHPAARLGELDPPDRPWPIAASHPLSHQRVLVTGAPGAPVLDGHPVHARRPLVRRHPLVGTGQLGRGRHPFHQVLRQGSLPVQRPKRLPLHAGPSSGSAVAGCAVAQGLQERLVEEVTPIVPALAAAPRSSSRSRRLLSFRIRPFAALPGRLLWPLLTPPRASDRVAAIRLGCRPETRRGLPG